MFWKRSAAVSSDETPPPVAAETDDAAVETLGAILRVVSEHAFDVSESAAIDISRTFDRWSRHVLVFGPHPFRPPEPGAPPARDYAGLRQHFRTHRKREAEYVTRSLTGLRSLIWMFVERLARNLPTETRFDTTTKEHILRLKRAVATSSFQELEREVLSAANYLEQAIADRNERREKEIEELTTAIDLLKEQMEDVRAESETDALTQLANRRVFDKQVERASAMTMLCAQRNVLLLVDVDHFKKVNDTHGHAGGDLVLKAIGVELVKSFPRKMDCVARYGGEELAVILRDSGLADGVRLAERFLASLRTMSVEYAGRTIRVTASAGVAACADGELAAEWIARADAALYRAKTEGRDRAVPA